MTATAAAPEPEPVAPRAARLGPLSNVLSWLSRWLLLNYPLLWRVRPSTLLLAVLVGHVVATWSAQRLPTSVLWDADLKFHMIPLAYAWALTVAVFILATRRMVVYRDAGQHPRQRVATLALALCVVAVLAWPADHFHQVVMHRQVAAFTAEDGVLVRRLAALQKSLLNRTGHSEDSPACADWPADWGAGSTAARVNDLMTRNQLDGALDEETLAASIAGQSAECGGAAASTVESHAYYFLVLSLERPLQLADVRELLDTSDGHSLVARHAVTLALVPLFWLALVLMSQPRQPSERRWLRRLAASTRGLARWPHLPLVGRFEAWLLHRHPAWWALWPVRILLLSTFVCALAAVFVPVLRDGGAGFVALLFGGLLYLAFGIALARRCHDVPLLIGDMRRPLAFVILVVTTLLPMLPFEALVLWLGASAGLGAIKGSAAMLAIVLYFVSPHLLTACLIVNAVRGSVAIVVAILGVLVTGMVAGAPGVHAPYLAGWLLGCLALSLRAVVPRRTGRQLGRVLTVLLLGLAPAALVAAMMLAEVEELTTGDGPLDLGILALWWFVLWMGPVQGMRRVLAAPGGWP